MIQPEVKTVTTTARTSVEFYLERNGIVWAHLPMRPAIMIGKIIEVKFGWHWSLREQAGYWPRGNSFNDGPYDEPRLAFEGLIGYCCNGRAHGYGED